MTIGLRKRNFIKLFLGILLSQKQKTQILLFQPSVIFYFPYFQNNKQINVDRTLFFCSMKIFRIDFSTKNDPNFQYLNKNFCSEYVQNFNFIKVQLIQTLNRSNPTIITRERETERGNSASRFFCTILKNIPFRD